MPKEGHEMRTCLLVAVILMLFVPTISTASDEAIRDEINTKITQLAALMGDSYSQEYPNFRAIKILRNEKEDMVVAVSIFTIEGLEGGNNYTQFLAVFAALTPTDEGHPLKMNLLDVMAVGGKGLRALEFKKMTIKQDKGNIAIRLPSLEYGPNDAMCCPSIKATANFVFEPHVGGRIIEITGKKRRLKQ
jgi:hypothetical protein